jgi:hypothetical protein
VVPTEATRTALEAVDSNLVDKGLHTPSHARDRASSRETKAPICGAFGSPLADSNRRTRSPRRSLPARQARSTSAASTVAHRRNRRRRRQSSRARTARSSSTAASGSSPRTGVFSIRTRGSHSAAAAPRRTSRSATEATNESGLRAARRRAPPRSQERSRHADDQGRRVALDRTLAAEGRRRSHPRRRSTLRPPSRLPPRRDA